MTINEVMKWMNKVGLQQHSELFCKHDVDGSLLSCLGANELRDIGIVNTFEQTKLLVKVRELKQQGFGE